LHCDLCGGGVELPEILRCEFDGNGSDVLFKALQFRGAGNWNDPGFLCKESGERDLSGCRIPVRSECSNQIHESAICLARFRREARETAAIVLLVKLRIFCNRPREESLAQRTERTDVFTASSLKSESTTAAPASANACAVASPMPEAAPVTSATLPLKSKGLFIVHASS
jgi:hypothetical protein